MHLRYQKVKGTGCPEVAQGGMLCSRLRDCLAAVSHNRTGICRGVDMQLQGGGDESVLREERERVKHWVAAGSKDGKVHL